MGRRFILEQSDSPSAPEGIQRDSAQIPLTSLADDIAVTRNLLAAQKGPTILVGHSYAGVVISGAANDSPSVEALVYIAAFGLDEGESIDALIKQGPAPDCVATTHLLLVSSFNQ